MATHAPMARVPFAPLDNPRLQQLASAKNRQNGIIAFASDPVGKSLPSSTKTSTKRAFEPTFFQDEAFDSENVDPASLASPSKKSKSDNGPVKPFAFTFSPSTTAKFQTQAQHSMAPPPPTIPTRLSSTPVRANMSSPRTPLTAPAGRSPKRKTSVADGSKFDKSRRVSAPFTRIDPPASFTNSRSSSSGLPFSLDAALKGTFAPATPSIKPATSSSSVATSVAATIQESMPKSWFFEIYEDSPDEEAATIMEHSTLTLDLSSDDEGSVKARDDRGKENTPPDGYDAPAASRPASPVVASASVAADAGPDAAGASAESTVDAPVATVSVVRKRKMHVDAMDDGVRSPLSELETEPEVVVDDELAKKQDKASKDEVVVWED